MRIQTVCSNLQFLLSFVTFTSAVTQQQPPPVPRVNPQILLYSSSPGPKLCRGSIIFDTPLTYPLPTAPQCYNIPTFSSCGVFTANKEDGCEAKLYTEWDCQEQGFTNIAVFVPLPNPVGGNILSLQVMCGILGVEPGPLNLPGLQMPANNGKTEVHRI